MSVAVYGRHDDDAVFEDDNGPARVPLRAPGVGNSIPHLRQFGAPRPQIPVIFEAPP